MKSREMSAINVLPYHERHFRHVFRLQILHLEFQCAIEHVSFVFLEPIYLKVKTAVRLTENMLNSSYSCGQISIESIYYIIYNNLNNIFKLIK